MTKPTVAVFAFVLAALASACQTFPEEPAAPTYAKDVAPILNAHCVRCHGAQGMLRKEIINGAESPEWGIIDCYLDQMDPRGDCTFDGGPPNLATCMPGAKFCASPISAGTTMTYFDIYVFQAANTVRRMPPPPAPELNEWEMNTLKRWVAMGAQP
jgi:hypothetical protein